jgi:hypothetical protein
MKSMETEEQGCLGIGSGCRSLYGRCRGFFNLEQVSKNNTNSLTAFHIWGYQKSREMSSNVLLNLKYPTTGKS